MGFDVGLVGRQNVNYVLVTFPLSARILHEMIIVISGDGVNGVGRSFQRAPGWDLNLLHHVSKTGSGQGKELRVSMTRKGRHPLEFRQMAVERMKRCENIVALSEELGVSRRLLYR
jgi:hypothetical protein